MYNAPYQGVADDLAKYGRYGDSMLVHMNPIEVGILASLSPTGELTTNPVTGQKEAFLPFLAPLLGSFLGQAFLPSLIPALAGKAALAGAIGSGLATTAATGDLKEGIISGLTGFGLGKAFGAASDALKGTETLAKELPAAVSNIPTDISIGTTPAVGPTITAAANQFTLPPVDAAAMTRQSLANLGQSGSSIINPPGISPTQALTAPFKQPGAFLSELSQPGTFLPIYAGTSVTEGIRQQEELDRLMKEQGLSEEEAKRKYEEDARRAIETVQRLYPQMRPKGMYAGGQVEGYYDGGMFGQNPFGDQYGLNNMSGGFYDTQFGQTSPSDIQGRLRGPVSVAAPYASYGALDVGGRGYLPGIAPEFQYFRQPEEVYPQPPMTMGRGKGGGFGGGMGGFGGMRSGKGGGFGGYSDPYGGYNQYSGYGSSYGSPYGGGYSSMPSKGGYANPRNSMGYGGYNTSFSPSYGGSYSNLYNRYSSPYYGGYQDQYGLNQPGNEPGKMYML